MGTSMQTPAKPSRSRRSPRDLTARYDRSNDEAARVILGDLKKHTDFQISWAHAFRRRRAQENREAGSQR